MVISIFTFQTVHQTPLFTQIRKIFNMNHYCLRGTTGNFAVCISWNCILFIFKNQRVVFIKPLRNYYHRIPPYELLSKLHHKWLLHRNFSGGSSPVPGRLNLRRCHFSWNRCISTWADRPIPLFNLGAFFPSINKAKPSALWVG